MPADDSLLGRVWVRLEDRYETDDVGCSCTVPAESVITLDESDLSPGDIAAYRRNELSMADLIAKLDIDEDPAAIDDLAGLVEALRTTDRKRKG